MKKDINNSGVESACASTAAVKSESNDSLKFNKGDNNSTVSKEERKYDTRWNFKKCNRKAFTNTHILGWFGNFDWLKPKVKEEKWDYDTVYNEARKYDTRGNFYKGNRNAYTIARLNGWLDNFDWLVRKKKWDYDTVYNEARKYDTRGKFMKGNRNAYEAARIKGWLDDYDWLNYKGKEKTILKTMCNKVETAKKELLAAYEELKLIKEIEPQNITLMNDIKADIEHKKIIYDFWKAKQNNNDGSVA